MANSEKTDGKKKKMGRMYEVMKKIRLRSHEFGEFCRCKRLKCVEKVSDKNKKRILDYFNSLLSHDEQNSYLCSLISLINVQKRRSRAKNKNEAKLHDSSYMYRVRIKSGEDDNDDSIRQNITEIQVCVKFFLAVHGITASKLQHLQKSLKMTGFAPKDRRGGKNYRKLKEDILETVRSHIESFKARQSHYSLRDNQSKTYLSETLNIRKMFLLFQEKYPEIKVAYQTYRDIFRRDFNIGFGYPRSDTCSECDELNAKMKAAENSDELSKLTIARELHLRKAQTFYDRKKADKMKARTDATFEAITLDYGKNSSLPNITTNDVYYRRQLSMYTFNIHVLSSSESYFYTYPEYVAKKGSDEVCSFLFHFIINSLDTEVQNLHIYCDGAGGQNKNYTVIRFVHYMVTVVKRLRSIVITYPVRGHSYLECDKNMGLINLKHRMEIPSDWEENISNSRVKPSPFFVISVTQDLVKEWTKFFTNRYLKKCPFAIQKMKEILCISSNPLTMFHRDAYHGNRLEHPIRSSAQSKKSKSLKESEFHLPNQSYFNFIPITEEKYKDIVFLSKFCESRDAKEMYVSIPHEKKQCKQKMSDKNKATHDPTVKSKSTALKRKIGKYLFIKYVLRYQKNINFQKNKMGTNKHQALQY